MAGHLRQTQVQEQINQIMGDLTALKDQKVVKLFQQEITDSKNGVEIGSEYQQLYESKVAVSYDQTSSIKPQAYWTNWTMDLPQTKSRN